MNYLAESEICKKGPHINLREQQSGKENLKKT